MQITNNATTVQLNEQKILDLIIRPDIRNLEAVFEEHYKCKFLNIPEDVQHTFFYLCRVDLNIKTPEIADIYDVSVSKLSRIIKKCFTKMSVNDAYALHLYKLHTMYNAKKTAA